MNLNIRTHLCEKLVQECEEAEDYLPELLKEGKIERRKERYKAWCSTA